MYRFLNLQNELNAQFENLENTIEQKVADLIDDEYVPSSTFGDYGPSNPWDAPGMSVRDFI